MIARVIVAGQARYYGNVVKAWADRWDTGGGYFHLQLDAHPSLVHFWLGDRTLRTSVLLAADGEAFTAALHEEAEGR